MIYKRPLFYLAVFLCAGILILHSAGLWDKIFPVSPQDVSKFALSGPKECFLGGRLVSEAEERSVWKNNKQSVFILEAQKLWDAETHEPSHVTGLAKVYLTGESSALRYGDEVVMKGRLDRPRPVSNPNGFDTRKYLEMQGVRAVFYTDAHSEYKKLGFKPRNPVFAKALRVKHFLSAAISDHFHGQTAAFLAALFLGERTDLDEEFKDLFMKTGTLHILAVSGFNIGFLCAVLWFFLKPFRMARDTKLLILLAAIWGYCLIVGWQPSMVRASLMSSVWILGKLLGRRPDILNTLGLAACVILLLRPKEIFDVGFQLSFLAVFALAKYLPVFYKPMELLPLETLSWRDKTLKYFQELFWGSFVCLLVTLPVTVQNFFIVTPLSLLANLAVVPVTFALFFLGSIFFLVFWLPAALGPLVTAVAWLMKLMVFSLKAVEAAPGAYFVVGKLAWPLWAVMTAGIFFLLETELLKDRFKRAFSLILFLAVIFGVQAAWLRASQEGKLRMTVLDVGQGDALYLEFPHGGNMLVDAGKGLFSDKGRWVVTPFLKSKGVSSIDVMVATHPQEDHIGGMPAVLDEFKVKKIIEPRVPYDSRLYEDFIAKVIEEHAEYKAAKAGETISDFKDVEINILNPFKESEPHKNVNEDSVVLGVRYRGTYWLLTGDIQKQAMQELLNSDEALDADVLKVPHHGAKLDATGRAFLDRVSPKVSIISVGQRNIFHHPRPETLEALAAVPDNKIYRTDLDGAVEVASDGSSLEVKTVRALT